MSKKKILIIINNFGVGGAERLVIDDANTLIQDDSVSFEIITIKKEGKNSLSDQLNSLVNWKCIPVKNFFDLPAYNALYKELKKFDPDIVFTHLWFANAIGRIVGTVARVKRIVSFEHNVYDNLKTKKMFFVDRILQVCSYRIIAVSEAVKKSLIRHGIHEHTIDVLLNGIDVSKYRGSDEQFLDGEQKKEFTFVFVGRLIHQKGVDILLKAFAKVKKGRLLIVGDGIEKERLLALSKELELQDMIRFLGVRKDIPDILKYADCFVLPSRYEGLPMVLLEAVAAQKMIIVSDFASAGEIIIHEENGLIVTREDVESLARAMSLVMSDAAVQTKLRQGVVRNAEKISIKKHVEALLQYV